jgi:serine/threonine protein kinase
MGESPFAKDVKQPEYIKLSIKKAPVLLDSALSKELKDLIEKLLTREPEKRGSLLDAIEHPFFKVAKIPSVLPLSCIKEMPD